MKVSDIYGSKYLKVEDVKGKKLDLVVEDVNEEEMKDDSGEKRMRLILTLEDCQKRLVLNAGNATALSEAFGDDTDEWIGAGFRLKVGKVNFRNKKVDGLIIEAAPPAIPD